MTASTAASRAPVRAESTSLIVSWRGLIGITCLVILLIPIRRYTLSAGLPIQLEPYRLAVAIVVGAWLCSLLADPRVRFRASGLDGPLMLFMSAVIASVVLNHDRVAALAIGPEVMKKVMFFASFVLVFVLIVSVLRTYADVEYVAKVLVIGGSIVAAVAIFEYRTGTNLFDVVLQRVPVLNVIDIQREGGRGGLIRATASSEHPIALGAAFVLLTPLSLYLAMKHRGVGWWAALGLLFVGALSTVSRTSFLMLAVCGIVVLWLRPRAVVRMWWAIPVLIVAAQLFVPGSLGTARYWFTSPNAVVAEQERGAGAGQGRLADLGPALAEFGQEPALGQGFGTRVTGDPTHAANVQILDDQWLKTLLETGLAGTLALLWLFIAAIRQLSRAAKADHTSRGFLLTGITAATAAYGVSMVTYDAFSFTQTTFLFFVVLALGAVLVRQHQAGLVDAHRAAHG